MKIGKEKNLFSVSGLLTNKIIFLDVSD